MQLLDEVVRMTGYKRPYAAWLLRNFGKSRLVRGLDGKPVRLVVGARNKRRPVVRPRKSEERVKKALVYLWDCFHRMCGKRLEAILPQMPAVLIHHRRLAKSEPAYGKLRRISAAPTHAYRKDTPHLLRRAEELQHRPSGRRLPALRDRGGGGADQRPLRGPAASDQYPPRSERSHEESPLRSQPSREGVSPDRQRARERAVGPP